MESNICLFAVNQNNYESVHIINFVLETTQIPFSQLKSLAVYKMHLVKSGCGYLHTTGSVIPLKKGDLFFTFPDMPFSIESADGFSYMYISFLGGKALGVMERLNISTHNFFFTDLEPDLCDFWGKCLNNASKMPETMAESVLLYTFSVLGNKILPDKDSKKAEKCAIHLRVKKYIDDNFTDASLSLEKISTALFYSPKYISTAFKRNFGVGISDYITTVRIQHSIALMKQGFTSISDISSQCGFSDPQYFSKVFKGRMLLSPKAYLEKYK